MFGAGLPTPPKRPTEGLLFNPQKLACANFSLALCPALKFRRWVAGAGLMFCEGSPGFREDAPTPATQTTPETKTSLPNCFERQAFITMGDPKPSAPPKQGWVATFVTRLCIIAWCSAVLTEILPRSMVESLVIVIGTQACILGLLACLIVGLRFRQGIFILLFVTTSVPAAYFAVVLREIARIKGWLT